MAMDLGNTATKFIYGFLGVVLLLVMGAALLPLVINASAVIGAIPDLPLASLWTSGIVVMIIVIGVIVAVIKSSSTIHK
jgi:membrane protein implicated in regulation of membrane protease activity